MIRRPKRLTWRKLKFGIGAGLVLATLTIVWLTGLASLRITLAESETRAEANLAVQTAVLERLLDKFRLLSPLLARGPEITRFYYSQNADTEPGIAAIAAGMSGAEEIWLMDATGKVVVSSQVLSEFYSVVTRKLERPVSHEIASEMVDRLAALIVVPLNGPLVVGAIAAARDWDLSLWDALILRAAATAGCEVLLSEDLADGHAYGSVRVSNPFA